MSGKTLPIDESRTLGVIPARGGSKSIPLKNLVEIAGRPMIDYVIAAGRASRRLDRLVCSTDHEAIAAACRARSVETVHRPDHLGTDDTPVTAVLIDLLERLAAAEGTAPGILALLQPTSPFLRGIDIDACLDALAADPAAQSAQTVTPVIHNAHALNQRVMEGGYVRFRFLEERQAAYNKQRKPKHFVFGNLVVTRSRALLAGLDCFASPSLPIEIPRSQALDVDTVEDVGMADYLVRGRLVQLDPA